jgi:hypothetical protein
VLALNSVKKFRFRKKSRATTTFIARSRYHVVTHFMYISLENYNYLLDFTVYVPLQCILMHVLNKESVLLALKCCASEIFHKLVICSKNATGN